jgi:hypothetical protein
MTEFPIDGVITKVHPPDQRGAIRIELDTDLRDPEIENDDGARTIYVKGITP